MAMIAMSKIRVLEGAGAMTTTTAMMGTMATMAEMATPERTTVTIPQRRRRKARAISTTPIRLR
jgi:hypothetical protein